MIKMERTCNTLRCDVVHEGRRIGRMEGVGVIQWFVKNKYRYTGTFSRFITENPDDSHSGLKVDIVFPDRKLVIKEALIEWMKNPCQNGTFHASSIESHV